MASLRVTVAATEAARLRGFLGSTEIGESEALLFENTRMLHTFGMRTRLDMVFVDGAFRIVRIVEKAAAWRIYAAFNARHVIEIAPGRARREGLALGDLLTLER